MPISVKFGRGGENSRGVRERREYYGNSIRWEDITQGLSIKRRFVLSYIYIPFAAPEPLVPPEEAAVLLAKTVSPPRETLLP